jgi:hypothetical protein
MLTFFFLGLTGGLASCEPIPEEVDTMCSSYNEKKFVEDSAFNTKNNKLYCYTCCS